MAFLAARWHDLTLLNWRVAPERVAAVCAAGTVPDIHDGSAWVSVVAFRMRDVRVLGMPVPGHIHFPEVNLRAYVKRRTPRGDRRGVVFVQELVPQAATAWVARELYGEPYQHAPMRLWREPAGADQVVHQRWRVGGRDHHLRVRLVGEPTVPEVTSHEAWLIDHFWGYSRVSDRRTHEYRVRHPRWATRTISELDWQIDTNAAYGSDWADLGQRQPDSVAHSIGSAVTVSTRRVLRFSPR